MNNRVVLIMFLCAVILASPVLAGAVSYPVSEEHRLLSEKSVVKTGGTVYLFHSGTPDVSKAIQVNDSVSVYGTRHHKTKEVGKIRVLSFVGEYYLRGEVLEGEVRHDDIAKKGGASCLVILESEMMK